MTEATSCGSGRPPPSAFLQTVTVVVPAGVQQHDGVAEVRAPAHHPAIAAAQRRAGQRVEPDAPHHPEDVGQAERETDLGGDEVRQSDHGEVGRTDVRKCRTELARR